MSVEIRQKAALAIPTAMSVAGYELVHDGVDRGITTPVGITEVFFGRMADLFDGFIARRYGLATGFGAFADAALDKKATKEILDAVSEEGLIPELLETAIKTQNLSNMALTMAAKVRHPKPALSPTRNGKRSMFLQGITMGSYALSETVREDHPRSAKALRYTGHVMGTVGLFYYGPRTTIDYAARLR
jgi:phosphatidylglycerophosphate synthase